MSHRLGSVIPESLLIGPASGVSPTGTNTWETTFSPPAAPGGTKYLMLHFSSVSLPGGNRLEVALSYDTDVFTAASGTDFWTRPIGGNSVSIRYIDDGVGPAAGGVTLDKYGRGEGLVNGGQTNANGDMFLLDSPFVDPTYTNPGTLCGPRSWENVASLPSGGTMDVTARSVGMIIATQSSAHPGHGCLPGESECLGTCSAALIDADLILTAGHCFSTDAEVSSASFTLDFQTNANGTRPAGYNPAFHKLRRVVRTGLSRESGDTRAALDYSILQMDTPAGGLPVSPLPLRADLPAMGESLFAIHHPRGATKKVSRQPNDSQCSVASISGNVILMGCDLDNGSSGSPLFDATGKIVGVNVGAGSCNNRAVSIIAITQDFLAAPPPPRDVDVMLVFDRSGSMSLPGLRSGLTKIQEARQAASLFIQLIQSAAGHRSGLVSFSTSASSPVDFALADVTDPNKNTLIGPAPFTTGIVGSLAPGGMTTIGGGLRAAQMQFPPPSRNANTPTILLMTDGLQNTPPMIATVEPELSNTDLCIIGFGTEGSLNGPLLTRLAREHGGIYTRAGNGLELKKFFALCFGSIFNTGILLDPEYVMPAGATAAAPIPFNVCEENTLTVVLGWEHPGADLRLHLVSPGGVVSGQATTKVQTSSGDTWTFLRVHLPFSGERAGTWQALVTRNVKGDPEFSVSAPEERFFVTTVVEGGPYLRPMAVTQPYYTGDALNPQVLLLYPDGAKVAAEVALEVTGPLESTGNLLTQSGLGPAMQVDGDQLDARSSTLIGLEQESGGPVVGTTTRTFELHDDGEPADGAMEPDGIYGALLQGLTRFEGNYTFHARAAFGEGCTATREASWSIYVSTGIDPSRTGIETVTVGALPDGRPQVRITFTPRDKYGNYLGPGRLGSFQVFGQPGSELIGGVRDAGDGSYIQEVAWEPGSVVPPGIVLVQPDRAPISICDTSLANEKLRRYGCLLWLELAIIALLLILGFRRKKS